ncbi:HEAT repeat domain-containing protein [Gemmata sp. G18]|uniref:HEAT repeat domain-containing protein n=1 Tax=Gemmata palustris TaxID=2822762 RepID=A0ABS5BYE3_9BACT|nr:HEAT repeat domain-containing protein [Gemmata palustris]MBP3958762.1 HEAT repeat domain-containing protein [Gemmata palustris]
MRHLALFTLLLGIGFTGGCGKKPAAPPPDDGDKTGDTSKSNPTPPLDEATAWRSKQLTGLKNSQDAPRRSAIDELSYLVLEDPATGPALVEMLKDKGTSGAGHTRTNQINSTREAAAIALLKAGPKGEALLKDRGLAILREGLSDPSATIREHSAYTIGQLGPLAKSLAPDVQKLCNDKDANVRGAAFDALRVTGVADPVALAKLLKHENAEVKRLAGELIPLIPDVPEGAVDPLSEALASDNANIQTSAATGLATAGPKAASAVPRLIEAITKYYPKEYDQKPRRTTNVEAAFWLSLARIGEPAVAPTAKLLEHTNVMVRAHAARTLGEIGAPAKAAKDALKKALTDRTINVSGEAAVALCILGESQDDAVNLIKQALAVPTEGVAAFAIDAITRMREPGKPLIPLALAKVTDPNPFTRFAVVTLIGKLPPDEATKHAADLGQLATDEEPDIRRLVARTLEQLGTHSSPAADALGKALTTEKVLDIRDQFVEALVAMEAGAKPALPALLPLITEKGLLVPLRVKAIAAVAAADPGSPEVAVALVKAASDDEGAIRAAAATAMGRINPLPPDALNTLVKMAKSDARNGPRIAALHALTVAGPRARPARSELEAMSTGPQPGLAIWAKVALASVDGAVSQSAPLVRAGLTDRNAAVRASASEALLVIGPTTADLPALLKLFRDDGTTARIAAATATGRLGAAAKDAVPLLVRQLDDREAEVRLAAAEALGRIGAASLPAVAKLKELRSDPLVKVAAQRALDKIGVK